MDQAVINEIKSLGIDMIGNAGSGHPGIVLSAAPILYTLYAKHLNIYVNDPHWLNRDRFILSAGHGSALLYSVLYMAGYLTLDDLKNFRRIDSKTPGHPEYGITPGVEMSTGPLGQGIASAVGMALGEKILKSRFQNLFDYHVYVLCGDGDLMEGISYEAASLAGTWGLDNLIVLYDSNRVTLDGPTEGVFTENVRARFEALGWNTEYVQNGESVKDIDKAIRHAKESKKPTLIEVRTILGNGSMHAGTNEVHGKVLGTEDVAGLKLKWGKKMEPFLVTEEYQEYFKEEIKKHSTKAYEEYSKRYRAYVDKNGTESLNFLLEKATLPDILNISVDIEKERISTRDSNALIMKEIAKKIPWFLTGSADLFSSSKNYLKNMGNILPREYNGSNIEFGVREHAMGAILNGLSLTGFQVSGSTFLAFMDYLKPSMRMSSLMNLKVTYLFSHDSIAIGSDGPTHQPVEQLSTLRAMPNMDVYRPADTLELIGAWNEILKRGRPSTLILSKQEQAILTSTKKEGVHRGAYIIRKESSLHGILIATGDEVHTASRIAEKLYEKYHLDLRVVSMPSMELFLEQDPEYQTALLPKGVRTVVMEASSSFGWEKFVYNPSFLLTIDHFGASGTKDEILNKFHYDYASLEERVKKLFL